MLTSRISSTAISIHIVPHLFHHTFMPLSSPLTSSAIPVIPHLYRASILILLRLCCSPHSIIFHRSVSFAAVDCLPSLIRYSPRSASFCTTLLAPLLSTLLFSLSALILSLRFYFLFWHGSSLSPWCSCSALICHVFFHLPSLSSATIWSFPSALSAPIYLLYIWYAQLWFLRSWSSLLAPICLVRLAQICFVFCSSGISNLSSNNLPLRYT